MKVRCISKNIAEILPAGIYDDLKVGGDPDQLLITVGEEYTVYGISTIRKYPWYLICRDNFDGIYVAHPMYLFYRYFEIVDNRLSNYWIVNDGNDFYNKNEKIIQFGFKEWISEEYFYSNLVEGEEREKKLFLHYKNKMDEEFR
jgi:hypothetical protein